MDYRNNIDPKLYLDPYNNTEEFNPYAEEKGFNTNHSNVGRFVLNVFGNNPNNALGPLNPNVNNFKPLNLSADAKPFDPFSAKKEEKKGLNPLAKEFKPPLTSEQLEKYSWVPPSRPNSLISREDIIRDLIEKDKKTEEYIAEIQEEEAKAEIQEEEANNSPIEEEQVIPETENKQKETNTETEKNSNNDPLPKNWVPPKYEKMPDPKEKPKQVVPTVPLDFKKALLSTPSASYKDVVRGEEPNPLKAAKKVEKLVNTVKVVKMELGKKEEIFEEEFENEVYLPPIFVNGIKISPTEHLTDNVNGIRGEDHKFTYKQIKKILNHQNKQISTFFKNTYKKIKNEEQKEFTKPFMVKVSENGKESIVLFVIDAYESRKKGADPVMYLKTIYRLNKYNVDKLSEAYKAGLKTLKID
ncbi:MAG: hypothetical protein Tsb0021_09070 [Chlamydiales bacterium]